MYLEYLLFDVFVFVGALLASYALRDRFTSLAHWLFFSLCGSLPFILWDFWATGRIWNFNPQKVIGVYIHNLPLEEVLFFLIVPTACMLLWQNIEEKYLHSRQKREVSFSHLFIFIISLFCMIVFYEKAYTRSLFLITSLVVAFDYISRARVLARPHFLFFLFVIVNALTFFWNSFLTGRPIVTYVASENLGIFVGTIPLEDFVYGMALITSVASFKQVFQKWKGYKTQYE